MNSDQAIHRIKLFYWVDNHKLNGRVCATLKWSEIKQLWVEGTRVPHPPYSAPWLAVQRWQLLLTCIIKARICLQSDVTEMICTDTVLFSFWPTDQWARRTSLLVIGWRLRERSHIGYWHCWTVCCNALLLPHWSVRQKLNHVRSIQFYSVMSLCTRFYKRRLGARLAWF